MQMILFLTAAVCALAVVVLLLRAWLDERRERNQFIGDLEDAARERLRFVPAAATTRSSREEKAARIDERMAALEAELFKAS